MLYNLTQAEAEIAVALEAKSIVELAQTRGTAVDTVRSQVKNISSKLGCHRQSEIVSIVSHLPKLADG
jgi:DNA-binding CsgD family transcriptional regulator